MKLNCKAGEHYFVLDYLQNNDVWVEVEVIEDTYKIEDGYKIELVSDNGHHYTYYQDDFNKLINDGLVFKKENENDHLEQGVAIVYLGGSFYDVTEGNYIVFSN